MNSPTNSTSNINYNNNSNLNNSNIDFLKLQLVYNNSNLNFNKQQSEKRNYENKAKAQCERILFNNCDIKNLENNYGIKLNHRTINNSNKKFMNGFCMMRLVWVFENVALIYLAFFQTFINVRRKFVKKIIDDFSAFSGDFQITCNNRHIVLLVPPLKSFQNYQNLNINTNLLNSLNYRHNLNNPNNHNYNINKIQNNLSSHCIADKEKAELLESQSASIFTYRPYKKLIDSYIFKKTFKYSNINRFIMEKFTQNILKQRLLENFNILNSNKKSIILVTKISVSKVKNIKEIENKKIISKRCLMIYILQLNEEKDELTIELSVEPVSGYYLFKFSENDIKIYDERKFFNALSNYYKNIDKEIFDSIKNFVYLMRETIFIKLCRENFLNENNNINNHIHNNYNNANKDNNFMSFNSHYTNQIFNEDLKIPEEKNTFNNGNINGFIRKNNSLNSIFPRKNNFDNTNGNFYNTNNSHDFRVSENIDINQNYNLSHNLNSLKNLNSENINYQSHNQNKNIPNSNIPKKFPKHDQFINSYLCFKNEDLKLNNSQLKYKIDLFRKELKDYCENILDDNANTKISQIINNNANNIHNNLNNNINIINNLNLKEPQITNGNLNMNNPLLYNSNSMVINNNKIKNFVENLKQSLPLVKEIEYKILEKRDIKKDISYIERIIVDRFYWYFAQLFESIMDSNFEDEEKCKYHVKVASKTSMILIRFPSIDKLLTCCKNQSRNSHDLVIHIKFYIISIEKLKQSVTKFAEILSEKASLKTLEFFDESEFSGKNTSSYSSFWDDNNSEISLESENKFYSRNEIFDIYPNQILGNMLFIIDELYKLMYHKNNLMTYIENYEGDLYNVLSNCLKYSINLNITDLFNCEMKLFMNNNHINNSCNLVGNNNKINFFNKSPHINRGTHSKNNCCFKFEFIQRKIYEILNEHFKYLTCNFYCNEKINLNNLVDSGSETNNTNNNSFTNENEIDKMNSSTNLIYNFNSAATLEKAKDLFIIELDLIQNFNGFSETSSNILLNDKEKYRDVIRDLCMRVKNLEIDESFSISLELKIYFIPDIEDIYSEMNFEQLSQDNYKMSCINLDNYSLYFHNTDNLSVMVPTFIKMQSNDYYVCINKKQKNFIRDIINSINSLIYLQQLENLRFSYNCGLIQDGLDYDKILEKMNMINTKNILSRNYLMRTCDKISTLNLLEKEEMAKNLIRLKDFKNINKTTRDYIVYMFDFEFSNDIQIQNFNNYILEKFQKQREEKNNYKIPLWMTFSLPNYSESNRKNSRFYSIEKYSEDEYISLEIKILNTEFLHDNNEMQNEADVDEVT